MAKPKIKILKKNKETELERDIIVSGCPPATDEDIKNLKDAANSDEWTFEFSPFMMEKLKEMGMTPEELIEKIKNENLTKD